MEIMIKRIYRQTPIVISIIAIISSFFAEWRFPLSVIIGSVIFLASLWSIVWAVNKFLHKGYAQAGIMFISALKMILIFTLLVVLAMLELINVVGFVTGFTVSLMMTAKEGFIASRRKIETS